MPSVQSPALVLVTGANGFLAIQLAKAYLEAGYSVRGTVRSESKGAFLREKFSQYKDRFSYVLVADMGKPGAYSEAIKGVDAVAHAASPVTLHATDPDELIVPAVRGTLGILEAADQEKSVKRVVITGSAASIRQPREYGYVHTEEDWNDAAVEAVTEKGGQAGSYTLYAASKVHAERAAWKFVEENKPAFDIVVLIPPWIFGPAEQEVKEAASLNASTVQFRDLVFGSSSATATKEELTTTKGSFVDVRDVARAHVLATHIPRAGGERLIISSGSFAVQQFLDAVNAAGIQTNKGFPGAASVHGPGVINGSKAVKILGLKYRSLEEVATVTAQQIVTQWPIAA